MTLPAPQLLAALDEEIRSQIDEQRWADAERALRAGAKDSASKQFALGVAIARQERFDEAIPYLDRAAALAPESPEPETALGTIALRQKDPARAVVHLSRARDLAPGDAAILTNLGAALNASGAHADAETVLAKAVQLRPDLAEAHLNLGAALHGQRRFREAIAAYEQATTAPTDVVAFNVSTAYEHMGDIPSALARLDTAIAANPNHADAHRNMGMLLLMMGRYAEGWREYDWRWRCDDFIPRSRPFPQSRWTGGPLRGALLIWGEQGIGDEVLYLGMLDDVVRRGVRIVVEVDARLVPLLERANPEIEFVPRRPVPDASLTSDRIEAQIPIASLGALVRSRLPFTPVRPYLASDPERKAAYARRLRIANGQLLVAIAWRSFNRQIGVSKSVALADFAALFALPGVQWLDLQYGDTASEVVAAQSEIGPVLRRLGDLDVFSDLDGVAAAIEACDLVITASNIVAHLAGALGVEAWVLVPGGTSKLWYWGHDGDATPWYPTVRIFRQSKVGCWRAPLDAIGRDLAARVNRVGRGR
jgi:tetratricopeptide (TPR) repeat protein